MIDPKKDLIVSFSGSVVIPIDDIFYEEDVAEPTIDDVLTLMKKDYWSLFSDWNLHDAVEIFIQFDGQMADVKP